MEHTLTLPIAPHLRDHAFAGDAVLPAVEAMRLLADAVGEFRKEMSANGPAPDAGDSISALTVVIREARFEKFLPLPPETASVEVIRHLEARPDGSVEAALLTRRVMGKSGLVRRLEHARMVFAGREGENPSSDEAPAAEWAQGGSPEEGRAQGPPLRDGRGFAVPAERLYAELVPFGPAFRNIVGDAVLYPDRAEALVRAPAPPGPDAEERSPDLGSPFPLDAAFHVACAWSQRYAGIVAFPVGFGERRVIRPIGPDETCRGLILPRGADSGALLFDLLLVDPDNTPREILTTLRMRDVSNGRWRPPAWIASIPGSE